MVVLTLISAVVYKITAIINGIECVYIGSTKDLDKRIKRHESCCYYPDAYKPQPFHRKIGDDWENCKVKVLHRFSDGITDVELKKKEQECIDEHGGVKSPNVLNERNAYIPERVNCPHCGKDMAKGSLHKHKENTVCKGIQELVCEQNKIKKGNERIENLIGTREKSSDEDDLIVRGNEQMKNLHIMIEDIRNPECSNNGSTVSYIKKLYECDDDTIELLIKDQKQMINKLVKEKIEEVVKKHKEEVEEANKRKEKRIEEIMKETGIDSDSR